MQNRGTRNVMNVRGRDGRGQQVRPRHRYIALARDARMRGDLVEMENCYQHAEHYFRVLRAEDP